MKNKNLVIPIVIFLIVALLVLSFIELPNFIENTIYFLFGIVGAYFIYLKYFVGMNEEEKKSWKLNLDLTPNDIKDVINNQFNQSDDGFLNKKTIFKVGDIRD